MDLIFEKLLAFVLVLTRISAFFLVAPVFSWNAIPARVKVAIILMISIFFSMLIPFAINTKQVSILQAILLIANESLYGLFLGLTVAILFSAVKLGGGIIDRQMGLAMANILDPMTAESTQPLGALLEMIFIILFLSANGHHLLLSIISRSYEAFPAGSIPTIPIMVEGIIKSSSALLIAGLRLAAPMLAALLMLMVVLAVLARITPEMNILFISLPLSVGLGLLMAAIFLPLVNGFVAEFADWMGKLLPL
jgi:flagellar biosynthetic protein FliR